MSGEPPEEPPRRYRRRPGLGAHLPVVAGIVIGAAAIVVAVIFLRGGDSGEAATPTQPTTRAATTEAGPILRIVFPEGFTRAQMAERIDAVNEIAHSERDVETNLVSQRYVALTKRSELPGQLAGDGKERSLEGFLFPATYSFTPATTTQELVEMQLAAFQEAWAQIDLSRAAEKNLTPYDVLIIASMIEEEVRVPKERALVAAVIYNRLRGKIPLGIDATLRYGLEIPPTEPITQADLDSDNPYNTRKRLGLPPTPISNPGLAAMQAAAHPADVPYLFFVRKKDCKSHYFARTEQQFLRFLEGPNSFRNGPNECA
jgi:uncharacterized YceG family protein